MSSRIPTKVSQYSIVRRLGVGGMAEVFLAHDRNGREVVLKRLFPEEKIDGDREEHEKMFLREAQYAGQLKHKNVIDVFDYGKDKDGLYIVMEYLHGLTLRELGILVWQTGCMLPLETVLMIIAEVASGLHYAHNYEDPAGKFTGLIHRDVSPDNIFLTYDGKVKVLDFGIVKPLGAAEVTQAGILKGKFNFMAPELFEEINASPVTDVYALGVTLYLLATGKNPHSGKDGVKLVRALIENDPLSPQQRNPDIPEPVNDFILNMLCREPGGRVPNCFAVISAIKILLRGRVGFMSPAELMLKVKNRSPLPLPSDRPGARPQVPWQTATEPQETDPGLFARTDTSIMSDLAPLNGDIPLFEEGLDEARPKPPSATPQRPKSAEPSPHERVIGTPSNPSRLEGAAMVATTEPASRLVENDTQVLDMESLASDPSPWRAEPLRTKESGKKKWAARLIPLALLFFGIGLGIWGGKIAAANDGFLKWANLLPSLDDETTQVDDEPADTEEPNSGREEDGQENTDDPEPGGDAPEDEDEGTKDEEPEDTDDGVPPSDEETTDGSEGALASADAETDDAETDGSDEATDEEGSNDEVDDSDDASSETPDTATTKAPVKPASKKPARRKSTKTVRVRGPSRIRWTLRGKTLRKGSGTLEVSKKTKNLVAYDPVWGVKTFVKASGTADYNKLKRYPVTIRVRPFASVQIGQKKLGVTPFQAPLKLVAGRYNVILTWNGVKKTQRIVVGTKKSVTLAVDMRK